MRALIALLVVLSPLCEAIAGAWPQNPGETFTSQTFRYFATDAKDNPKFERASVAAYAEYGLLETVTLGVELDQGQRLDETGKGLTGGRLGGFVRARVWRGEAGDVASIQVGASTPISGLQIAAAPGEDDAKEYKALLQYGRGFQSEWGTGWAEAAFGFAHQTGGRADEIKFDATLGLRPDENWIALAQLFGTYGLRNAAFAAPDFDVAKVQLSVGRKFLKNRTLIIGVARDVFARGTDKGWEASLSIWSTF